MLSKEFDTSIIHILFAIFFFTNTLIINLKCLANPPPPERSCLAVAWRGAWAGLGGVVVVLAFQRPSARVGALLWGEMGGRVAWNRPRGGIPTLRVSLCVRTPPPRLVASPMYNQLLIIKLKLRRLIKSDLNEKRSVNAEALGARQVHSW